MSEWNTISSHKVDIQTCIQLVAGRAKDLGCEYCDEDSYRGLASIIHQVNPAGRVKTGHVLVTITSLEDTVWCKHSSFKTVRTNPKFPDALSPELYDVIDPIECPVAYPYQR